MQKPIIAFLIAFFTCLITGPLIIIWLKHLKFGQNVRNDGPQSHAKKQGTPTMGGLIMCIAIVVATLIMGSKTWNFTAMALVLTLGFGLIGFLDDFIKVCKKRSLGLRAYQKLIGQFGLAVIVAVWAYYDPNIGSRLLIPWLNINMDLGIFYIPFTVLVIVSVVNAVNLTDGLDGLASGVMMIDSVTFCLIFAVLSAAALIAGDVLYVAELDNMAVFCAAVAGSTLGFLRFNVYPAKVFMGDTGSMGLGGAFAAMGILSGGQLVLPIVGIMFVLSALSVILQVGSFKLRGGKRIFLMAPLHHHFELKGNHETKIVSMYMIVTAVCSLGVLLGFIN